MYNLKGMISILEEEVIGCYGSRVRFVLVEGRVIGEVFFEGMIFYMDITDNG